jgi:hypothetical protein
MKYFLLIGIFFIHHVYAQESPQSDCNTVDSNYVDKISGQSHLALRDPLFVSDDKGRSGFDVFLVKVQNTVVVRINVKGFGSCIDDNAPADVLFTDNTRLHIVSHSDFNCVGKFVFYLGGQLDPNNYLDVFNTKKIASLRIWGRSNDAKDEDFTVKQADIILKGVQCLSQ